MLDEVERITAAMDASGYTYELLAIDDARPTTRWPCCRRPRRGSRTCGCRAFRRNGGSGTARRIGTQEARGEIVVWTDADMTYPNERIPELVEILDKDPTVDQVVGARTSEEGTHKLLRVPAKWVIRKIAEQLAGHEDPRPQLRAARVPARRVACPTCGCCRPGSPASRRSRWRSCRNQHDVHYVPIDYAKRAGHVEVPLRHGTPTATSCRCCGWSCTSTRSRCSCRSRCGWWRSGSVKGVYDLVAHPAASPANTVLIFMTGLLIAVRGAARRPDRALAGRIACASPSSAPPIRTKGAGRSTPPSWRTG